MSTTDPSSSNASEPGLHATVKALRALAAKQQQGIDVARVQLEVQRRAAMASNSLFPSFLESSSSASTNPSSLPRLSPSPINPPQQPPANVNGNNVAAMNGMPVGAGQQMDVNFLYQKVVELSEILKENRERTAGIVAGAEELAVSAFLPCAPNCVEHSDHTKTKLTILPTLRLVLLRTEPYLLFKKRMQRFQVNALLPTLRIRDFKTKSSLQRLASLI